MACTTSTRSNAQRRSCSNRLFTSTEPSPARPRSARGAHSQPALAVRCAIAGVRNAKTPPAEHLNAGPSPHIAPESSPRVVLAHHTAGTIWRPVIA